MSYGYISLSLGSLSIVIDTFTSDNYPRLPGDFAEPQLNANQNLIAPGNPFGSREKFNFTGVLTKAQTLDLMSLYREHRRLVDNTQNGNVLIYDTILEFQELGSTPTRGRAATPFNGVTNSGGYCHYFAGFYTHFQSQPEALPYGVDPVGNILMEVTLSLIETGDKVPV